MVMTRAISCHNITSAGRRYLTQRLLHMYLVSPLSSYRNLTLDLITYICTYNIPLISLNSPKIFSNAKTSFTTPILTKPIQYTWNSSSNRSYMSWHTRPTDDTISPFTFIMIWRCIKPADRTCRIERVMWIPTRAKGYHGSVIWRAWLEPDSDTILFATTGYVVQKEWNCFKPRRPQVVRKGLRRRYLWRGNQFQGTFLGNRV